MLLVDTSVWIDILGKNEKFKFNPNQFQNFAICPPILQEILQGIRSDPIHLQIEESLLALPRVGDPALIEDYLSAACIFRTGRKKGLTIRSSVDCLIAAIALREKLPVWHSDRDFNYISQFTGLEIYTDSS